MGIKIWYLDMVHTMLIKSHSDLYLLGKMTVVLVAGKSQELLVLLFNDDMYVIHCEALTSVPSPQYIEVDLKR